MDVKKFSVHKEMLFQDSPNLNEQRMSSPEMFFLSGRFIFVTTQNDVHENKALDNQMKTLSEKESWQMKGTLQM